MNPKKNANIPENNLVENVEFLLQFSAIESATKFIDTITNKKPIFNASINIVLKYSSYSNVFPIFLATSALRLNIDPLSLLLLLLAILLI